MKELIQQNSSTLKKIADKLAMNCVNNSLWDVIVKEQNIYKQVFDKNCVLCRGRIQCPERLIVVVGAGASHDAFSKLSLGSDAADELKDHFKKQLGPQSDLIERELVRLERVYRLNKEDFETILLAISKFYPQDLKREISKRYQHRFYPSLTYEVIAHLMKHRFVDAVINFNYDELLDQAIEDELGSEEYKKVIAEGDYSNASTMDQGAGLRYPIYIKPHGTCSNPSSLRFTREDYFTVPIGISSLIEKLLSGTTIQIDETTEVTPVNLIVVGFNMQSFEFNMLFEKCFPPESKIYFINTNLPTLTNLWEPSEENSIKREEFLKMFVKENLVQVSRERGSITEMNTLDMIFNDLWTKIEKNFHEDYKPRSITRHELISGLFKEHELIKESKQLEYLKDRSWVELTLSLSKYKGFVSFIQSIDDRFGKYFSLYRQELEETVDELTSKIGAADFNNQTEEYKKSIREKLDHISNENIFPRTIWSFCKQIGLKPIGYSNKAFQLPNDSGSLTVDKENFETQVSNIYETLLTKLNQKTKDRLNLLKNLFLQTLYDLFLKEDSEVSPKYDYSYKSMFLNPKLIKTSLSLDYQTRFQFKKNDWTALFVVAETGEWILKKTNEFNDKEVILVIADNVKESKLFEKIGNKNLTIHKLKWWLHNQHMTIFLKGKKPNYEPVRAIYFVRRHRGTHLHPVFLEGEDCKLLIEAFAAYCQKSINIEKYKAKGLATEVCKNDINEFMNKYFPQSFIIK